MKLPIRVQGRHGWLYFISMIVLDSILSLAIAFGPSALLFHYFAPGTFFERFVSIVVCGVLFCIMGFVAFMFWAFFITETTGY